MKGDCNPGRRVGLALLLMLIFQASYSSGAVRKSALAGSWYPADPLQLAALVDGFLDQAVADEMESTAPIRALILPHAGYRYSGATAGRGFGLIRGNRYRRVIVLAPSHHSPFHGLSIPEVDAYATPLGKVPLDLDAVRQLRSSPFVVSDPYAHGQEHSIEIELPFLQRALLPGWKLVPLLVGQLQEREYPAVAGLIKKLLDGETLLLVSSDFTHYGPRFDYQPFPLDGKTASEIRRLDQGALEHILEGNPEEFLAYKQKTGITICGFRPIALLLHLLPESASLQEVAYETSGELTDNFRHSVSYVVIVVNAAQPLMSSGDGKPPNTKDEMSDANLKLLHKLALLGIEQAVLGGANEVPSQLDNLPEELKRPRGAFVTLKKAGQLRGCIGYIQPRFPLYQAVLENGVNAASRDYRFRPVTVEELADLEVEVSVLTAPQPIKSIDMFEVGKHGIIMHKGGHRAVFLPEVAVENGWNREETLKNLALKAGLPADIWRSDTEFEVFSSESYTAPYMRH